MCNDCSHGTHSFCQTSFLHAFSLSPIHYGPERFYCLFHSARAKENCLDEIENYIYEKIIFYLNLLRNIVKKLEKIVYLLWLLVFCSSLHRVLLDSNCSNFIWCVCERIMRWALCMPGEINAAPSNTHHNRCDSNALNAFFQSIFSSFFRSVRKFCVSVVVSSCLCTRIERA